MRASLPFLRFRHRDFVFSFPAARRFFIVYIHLQDIQMFTSNKIFAHPTRTWREQYLYSFARESSQTGVQWRFLNPNLDYCLTKK